MPGKSIEVHFVRQGRIMLDAMYLAIGLGFLAIAVLYVVICDRL